MRTHAIALLALLAAPLAAADQDQFKALTKLGLTGTPLVLVDSLPFRTSKGLGDQLDLYDQSNTRFQVTATLRPDGSITLVRIERLTPGSVLPEPVITVPRILPPDFDPLAVHGIVVPTVVEADRADVVQANLGGGGARLGSTFSAPAGAGPGLGGVVITPPITRPSPN
jgi:hypothetical protein